MQTRIIDKLCCPFSKQNLELKAFKSEKRKYKQGEAEEITEGVLISESGWLYPIIDGVPRFQLDAFLEFGDFLSDNYEQYIKSKNLLLDRYSPIIESAVKKTKKTKKSFGQEWKIFEYESDKTWGYTKDMRKERFLKELNITGGELKGKTFFDVGCGNGVLTTGIAEFGAETFGMDVSESVIRAFHSNDNINAHFLQGDLQNCPFKVSSMDFVYSTGVIHHTNNTELSFSCLTPLVKPGGRFYVWLYKPENDLRHRFLRNLRKFTNKLPIWLQYTFYLTCLVPQGMIKERLRGKKISWREQLINYFDVLSCEFRHEHTTEEVEAWYKKRNFENINVPIIEYLGFGMYGDLKKS